MFVPDRPWIDAPHDSARSRPALPAPEAIARCRTTRHFDPEQELDDDRLKTILHLATLAPSADNLQPWRFVVVRSARNRKRLQTCAYNQARIGEAPVVLIVLGYQNPHRDDLDPMVDHQERLGAISREQGFAMRSNVRKAMERRTEPAVWATRAAMLAATTLMIAAESLGVASALMEGFDEARLREAFGVPDDHTVCCLIALGYATEPAPFPGRFGLGHVCFEEHFGQPWTLGELPGGMNPQVESSLSDAL